MRDSKTILTLDILANIYNLSIENPCHNERYLHHYFTEKIQKDFPIYFENINKSKLHPEWATANKIRKNGGKYKYNKSKKIYEIDENGTSGFVDFVLGDYNNPEIGIEFKYNSSWKFEPIVFDYMKLMDINNSFQTVVSFAIIYREKEPSKKLKLDTIKKTVEQFKDRLNDRLDRNRPFLFWIVEIAYNCEKIKSWYCVNLEDNFKEGIPKFE